MTLGELAVLLDLTEPYLKSHWKKVVESYATKRCIKLYKMGKADSANYGICFPWEPDTVYWDSDSIEMF